MLLIASFVNAGMVSVMSRILPYLGVRLEALVAFSVGTMALLPMVRHVAAHFGEHRAFLLASLLVAASCIGLSCSFHFSGLNGLLALNAFAFLYGGGMFGCTMLLWSTAANLIHHHGAQTGQRADTLSYGIFTFASKFGIALSMIALGAALEPVALLPSGDYSNALNKAAVLGVVGAVISTLATYRMMRAFGETTAVAETAQH